MNCHLKKRSLLWVVPAALILSTPVAHAQDTGGATPAPKVAQTLEERFPEGVPQGIFFPYPLLSQALEGKMDKNGNINYLELKGNANLAMFVRALETADLKQFPVHTVKVVDPKKGKETTRESRAAELTFWINAYNAHVLKAVSDAYPVKSPYDIKDLDTAKTRLVAGQTFSLKEMREKITAMDKRAFFALTDGTSGGPLLPMTGVYWYSDLDAHLDNAAASFVRNNRNVEVNTIQKYAIISENLRLADTLFKQGAGRDRWSGIRNVLALYSEGYNRKFFTAQHYDIRFVPANKSLNDYTETSAAG